MVWYFQPFQHVIEVYGDFVSFCKGLSFDVSTRQLDLRSDETMRLFNAFELVEFDFLDLQHRFVLFHHFWLNKLQLSFLPQFEAFLLYHYTCTLYSPLKSNIQCQSSPSILTIHQIAQLHPSILYDQPSILHDFPFELET